MTGELPHGWARTTLGDLCSVEYGKGLPKKDRDATGSVGVYGSAGLVGLHGRSVVEEPVIVVGRKGNAGSVWLTDGPSWPIDTTYFLRPPKELSADFLALQLGSCDLVQKDSSTTIPSLRRPDLEAAPVLVAPAQEQKQIVAAIEELFSRLDAVEATAVGARRRLEVLRHAIMDRAFYNDSSSELTAEIGDLAEVSGGIQKQPKRRPLENRYPFLRVANVGRGNLDLADVHEIELFEGEIGRFRLRKGDLLVVEGNGSVNQIGRAALWGGQIEDCVHQNHLIRVRPGERLLPEYLTLCWNAPRTAQQIQAVASSTSGLYTLSTSKVKSIRIPIVQLSVQQSVVEQLDQQLRSIEMAYAAAGDANGRVSALRRAVLAQAFSGQLLPQNPNDEPASALLERIAASR